MRCLGCPFEMWLLSSLVIRVGPANDYCALQEQNRSGRHALFLQESRNGPVRSFSLIFFLVVFIDGRKYISNSNYTNRVASA